MLTLVLRLAIALVTVALATTTGSAAADASLNLPPLFWYTCKATGSGAICHGTMNFQHIGVFDATCSQGFDILENGYSEERGARYCKWTRREGDIPAPDRPP